MAMTEKEKTHNHTKPKKRNGRYYSSLTIEEGLIVMKYDVWGDSVEEVEVKVRRLLVQAGIYK